MVLRTPDARFARLPGPSFAPRYVEVDGMRVHYLDEGRATDDEVVLCLHGALAWSFTWRAVVDDLRHVARVIAPDFLGYGRSDKYARRDAYSLAMHERTLHALLTRLALPPATLVAHDWGGIVALLLAAAAPERVRRLVLVNTGLPLRGQLAPSSWAHARRALLFLGWRAFAGLHPDLPVGRLVAASTAAPLPPAVIAAYDAPFPDRRFKAGVAASPAMVPLLPWSAGTRRLRAAAARLRRRPPPTLLVFSADDPFTRCELPDLQALLPTARAPRLVPGAGHLLQEDAAPALAAAIRDVLDHVAAAGRRRSAAGAHHDR